MENNPHEDPAHIFSSPEKGSHTGNTPNIGDTSEMYFDASHDTSRTLYDRLRTLCQSKYQTQIVSHDVTILRIAEMIGALDHFRNRFDEFGVKIRNGLSAYADAQFKSEILHLLHSQNMITYINYRAINDDRIIAQIKSLMPNEAPEIEPTILEAENSSAQRTKK